MAPNWLKKNSLKNRDDQRTKAAELTLRQSIYPIVLVTILFFLWVSESIAYRCKSIPNHQRCPHELSLTSSINSQGFSYGLLDTLNKHFQIVLDITRARSSGLQAAYFGAYPLASLGHANWILRHYGYKATFIWGLCLYGIGSLVAWPCILYRSFGGFCAAIFIIGNGLGSLETAANPYITVCGPPKYSEIRINFSQAFNG
jgi:FHS family L-fucose permease-like MFS transporter